MNPYYSLLKKKSPGDQILASDWNLLVSLLSRTTMQPGMMEFAHGVAVVPPRGGGGPAAATKVGKITGKSGTSAPYGYTGYEVEHDGSSDHLPGNYSQKNGGDTFDWKLVNAQEIGSSGDGVAPLAIGSVVPYWANGTKWMCSASNYRGTYSRG